jgi:CRP-like cAMP-binding protein
MFRSSAQPPSALAQVELFRGLEPKELAHLEGLTRPRHYEPGEEVVREGESGVALFIVLRGRLRVTQRTAEGATRELRTIDAGGVFGEMAILSDRPRSATITAIEPTDCLALHRLDFVDAMRAHPEIAIRLLDTLSRR